MSNSHSRAYLLIFQGLVGYFVYKLMVFIKEVKSGL